MLKLHVNSIGIHVNVWKFPAGEVGVKVEFPLPVLEAVADNSDTFAHIILDWESNDDLIALEQLVDILRNHGFVCICLHCPYFPYARQDRPCNPGEAFALRCITSRINALNLWRVYVSDPHSAVLKRELANLTEIPLYSCYNGPTGEQTLVAPDAGARAKVEALAKALGITSPIVTGVKERDASGKITGLRLEGLPEYPVNEFTVVDDICDGGATFIALAKNLPNGLTRNLYVTHGIFSKGYDELFAHYDHIFVYNRLRCAPAVPSKYAHRFHFQH